MPTDHKPVIMSGHVSPETAYVVDNYPYGFRLKCRIRYWLEYTPKKGVRMWSQTTNPKRPGWIWNKPKASIYSRFGGCMYLDEQEHVQFAGLTEYTDGPQAAAWRDQYGAGVPPECVDTLNLWVRMKLAYDARIAEGKSMNSAAALATIDSVKQERAA